MNLKMISAILRLIKFIVLPLLLLAVLTTCERPERIVKLITLDAVTGDISYTSATLKGQITDLGSKSIGDHGIMISENAEMLDPTPKGLGPVSVKGTYQVNFTDLKKNTIYYFKAYVTVDSKTILADNTKQFRTLDFEIPVLITTPVTDIKTTQATSGGTITVTGGELISKKGLCWSKNAGVNLTNAIDTTVSLSAGNSWISTISELEPGHEYFIRSYAINSQGTGYGNELNFTTTGIMEVVALDATVITNNTAIFNGTVKANNLSTVVTFEYGNTTSYGQNVTVAQSPVSGNTVINISEPVTGLSPGTTYHFRLKAVNTSGTVYGTDLSFKTTSTGLTTTAPATSVTTTDAILNGNLYPNNLSTTVTFEYGTTTSYGNVVPALQSPASGTNPVAVTAALGGLTPGTTYHYKVKAVNTSGTTEGEDVTFTTLKLPDATTGSATSITPSGATLNGTVNANNSQTDVTFEYGVIGYGFTIDAIQSPVSGNTVTSVSATISGFSAGTEIQFRIKAGSDAGTTWGNIQTFTTLSTPTVLISSATSVTVSSAMLNGTVNANSSSTVVTFEYGPTTAYGNEVSATQNPVTGNSVTSVSAPVLGLSQGTTTHYRIKAVNAVGTSYSSDQSFVTLMLPVATTDAATDVTASSATLNGTVDANNSSTVVTFEYGQTTSYGTSVTATQSPVTGTNSTPVSASISGLASSTTYHYKVKAVSTAGTTEGSDVTFTTGIVVTLPTVTTTAITDISTTTATGGGNVTADGGATVTARGVCWSTTLNPEITNSKTTDGSGIGSYPSSIAGLTSGITYHVRAYATNSVGIAYGADVIFTTQDVPIVTTETLSSIASQSAISGGNVTSTGGLPVTVKGICWSTNPNPTTADPQTINGSGAGSFTSNLSGLLPNTTYYTRAYATNSLGTGYGSQLTFTTLSQITDIEGNIYNIVTIGTQTWMQENLKTLHYRDGSLLPNNSSVWTGTSDITGQACWLNNDIANKNPYGALYNLYAVINNRILCPVGWHAPTDAEWTTLVTYLGGGSVAGGKLKEAGVLHWNSPNTGATNESGFTSMGASYRYGSTFYALGGSTLYWSTTFSGGWNAYGRKLSYNDAVISRTNYGYFMGMSVRCLQGEGVVLPALTSNAITNITATTAISGGNVSSNGGGPLTARGVCWGTSHNPEVTDNHTSDGTLTGLFTSNITGLSVGVTYYLRAYATNSVGTAYGEEVSFQAVYNIGDSYQGGIIFQITGTYPTQHGLICAQADQSINVTWGCDGSVIAGADGTAVGTGNQNTIDIINGCAEAGIAARICSDLSLNGYTDWYLPSLDELGLLVTKYRETLSPVFGGEYYYWSSSEYSGNPSAEALYYNFVTGVSVNVSKTQTAHVRAVRTF